MTEVPGRSDRGRPSAEPADTLEAVREAYDRYNAGLAGSRYDRFVRFMNFGCDPPEGSGDEPATPGVRRSRPPAVHLAEAVLADEPLADRVVLDAGCGRGGVVDLIGRRAPSATVIGLDLVESSLRVVQASSAAPVIRADAQRLPVRARALDVVVSIESAVHYPDVAIFYAEVGRCLRPGGALLYADLWVAAAIDEYRELMAIAGLEVEEDIDITEAVMTARRRRARRERLALTSLGGGVESRLVAEPGSPFFEAFASGELCYRRLRARRTGAPPPATMATPSSTITAAARFSLTAMAAPVPGPS